ncbi:MAG: bifunctional DNA primase/polymerase [Saccharopolyspora sp.]|uniref:bifunctional DNA primase/polymerase n=1 Tax=Saccharopolyspora sp. TaxID=33915 RepID=UPI0025FE67D9|nr:bifunctional DNA primase/polymerase [Saccharopolyspora sp.]MBQ6641089.1 bifunctional DNA primase/polymerase [Saccharopolyspora sp.]
MDWSADERPGVATGTGVAPETSVAGSGTGGWRGAADWAGAFRIELRVQAIELAARSWPVVPGTFPVAATGRWSGGGSTGPVPVHEDWQDRRSTDADQVAAWFGERPYSLLIATGDEVEALEVGAELGRRAARALRSMGAPAPIVATPDARWYFLAAGGRAAAVCPELVTAGAVRRHTAGSWLPVPPSTFHHGVVHWRVKPEVCGWRLPSPEVIGDALRIGADTAEDVAQLVVAGN